MMNSIHKSFSAKLTIAILLLKIHDILAVSKAYKTAKEIS
jgi:hypothetical protein